MKTLTGIFALLLLATGLRAAEVMPPAPRDHFNDYAGVVDPATARQLNAELAQFERDTSNQIVVAVFPHMQSDSSVSDYTFRVAQAWGVGTKGHNNGAALFVFTQDRETYIQVGYGLEGAMPDALCKQIIEDEIVPRFRANDYSGGLANGVHAMMAAAKGEYRGSGKTVREGRQGAGNQPAGALFWWALVIMIVLFRLWRAIFRGNVYGRSGRRGIWWGGGGWGGGGGWSGGGGGGGTFSGGGGSFGGGGAGGHW